MFNPTISCYELLDYFTRSKYSCRYSVFRLSKGIRFSTPLSSFCHVKLEAYGIRTGKLLHWIKLFLVNRRQKVVLKIVVFLLTGQPYTVESLKDQSWLFNIYVNDIPSLIDSQTLMFADDTKIFREIITRADFIQFQEDIDPLLTWSDKWQFNNSKCYILHLIPMEIILR